MVTRIDISAREYAAGRLDEGNLEAAVAAMDQDGVLVLGGAIDHATLDFLKPKLEADTAELLARGKWGGAGAVPGHLQQAMPRTAEYILPDLVANPLVVHVTSTILGPEVHNHFYNGNTNMPGSRTQPLHRDSPPLWRDYVHPTASIVVNASLVDVDESNGATQIWPGTHRLREPVAESAVHVSPAEEEARRAAVPPARAVSRKGDVVLRDIRLWHRGMPNEGTAGRHMIGMVHSVGWLAKDRRIKVVRGAEKQFEHDVLTTPLEIVDEEFDYLGEWVAP
jgi:Phytanoyl-CoA dioxygenase (PhyH)